MRAMLGGGWGGQPIMCVCPPPKKVPPPKELIEAPPKTNHCQ